MDRDEILIKPSLQKLSPYEFWKKLGNPRFIVSPMVDQSELAFRILTRRYGAHLAYTPMLHSRLLFEDAKYRREHFETCSEDRPLIAQLCGDDPATLLRGAQVVESHVDAVDLNCGCPQGVARRGHYGAYLLQEPDLICDIIRTLSSNLSIPVTCKIRKVSSHLEDTLKLCYQLEASGVSALCIHGRTMHQKAQSTGECDWNSIKNIKMRLNIPIIANGGIETYEEALKCLELTGADAVMCAEGILENPALFSGKRVSPYTMAQEYLNIASIFPPASGSAVKSHLFKILHGRLELQPHIRERVTSATSINDYKDIAAEFSTSPDYPTMAWYRRHRGLVQQAPTQKSDYYYTNDDPLGLEFLL